MNRKKLSITTPFIKLDSFLKFCGVCGTGGEAKNIIRDGLVFVNGEKCLMRGKKLISGDVVTIRGQEFEVCKN